MMSKDLKQKNWFYENTHIQSYAKETIVKMTINGVIGSLHSNEANVVFYFGNTFHFLGFSHDKKMSLTYYRHIDCVLFQFLNLDACSLNLLLPRN